MGTRSDIIMRREDGKWARIYCHWDGYLENNGRILFDHYTSQRQANALAALGDLSSLGPDIGVKHSFEWRSKHKPGSATYEKYNRMCLAYGRDRGEKDVAAIVGDTLQAVWPEDETWTEFTYVWDGEKWWCGLPDEGTQTLLDLGDLLLGKRTLNASVKVFGAVVGHHHPTQPGKDHAWGGSL